MNDDDLNKLRNLGAEAPSEAARKRALDAALLAFDAVEQKKSQQAAQGNNWAARLRSIATPNRGTSRMNTRLTYGLGTAAVALLLLPLGYQLYTSTALTPPTGGPVVDPVAVEQKVLPAEQDKDAIGRVVAEPEAPVVMDDLSAQNEVRQELSAPKVETSMPQPSPAPEPLRKQAAGTQMFRDGNLSSAAPPAASVSADAAMMQESVLASRSGFAGGIVAAPPPGVTQPSGDSFTSFTESPLKTVADAPVSTFSIDVDTASYSYVRNALRDGWMPEPDAVRIEEMINYFTYDYTTPDSVEAPFAPNVAIYPTPWNPRTELIRIGIKGYVPPASEKKASNLVFLIDTSGSMDEANKLPLLKRAFSLLVDQLGPTDTVSIVAYAGSAGVVLEPTKASEKAKILTALENLGAGGSTAGAEGIELAYRLAEQNKVVGGVNRVLLATDGDFNVGIDDPEDLKTYIKQKRDSGVFLSVLGFGQGNLGDDTMQALAQNGNGNASYIDSFREAQKVLVSEGGGTLETIAKDVKIQIEFNPAIVSEYRLIGYETRALNREDFNNDKVDAGDIGAGTTVTALYEITPVGSGGTLVDPLRYGTNAETPVAAVMPSDEIAFLKLRYKLPEETESKLIELPITRAMAVTRLQQASDDSRFAAAVAAFGQKLKGSDYGTMRWDAIRDLAQGARGTDPSGYRAEFIQMIDTAALIDPEPFCTAPPQNRNCR